ncbi:MAG TPA: TldD/PmbA family protein [Acidimicrobiaceae bacterium]|nr:TldD/PmbA family protein [Acidimicrobiaceae bacterium]
MKPVSPLLDRELVQETLATAISNGGEWAEVFVEDRQSASADFDEGRVEAMVSSRDLGAGIRVTVGDLTGFAHTSDLTRRGLSEAAQAAASVARGVGRVEAVALHGNGLAESKARILPETISKTQKVELLEQANSAARAENAAISQVNVRYSEGRRRVLVANSEGLFNADDQTRTLLSVNCVATGDQGLQTGRETVGYTVGFELFEDHDIEAMAQRAAGRAVTKLAARPAPSGQLPVVIERGGGGVLFHEACGHGLEADLVNKGASVFRDRLGELVAAPSVTLVDDGTMGVEWGTVAIDDEGCRAQRNVLIEDGVLTDYMWDHLRSRAAGRPASGNGRRQSYQHLPMVRMTNTFVTNGDTEPQDIIAGTKHGVYVAQLGGGQVNTATGDFVFGMTEAYLIENGEITAPLREGNLIGNGPEVLKNIEVIGNDFAMGSPGTCGKDGQGVPVGDGQPTLRVAALTIGGTAS